MTNNDRGKLSLDAVEMQVSTSKKNRANVDVNAATPHIGQALRSVYDQTVSEAIPNEMLDLLDRLG